MRKLVFLSAITCALCACSPKEEPCDMTGERYTKMVKEGTPLTEKDKACVQAAFLKGMEASQKKLRADMQKQSEDLKTEKLKPIKWNQVLFPKKQGDTENSNGK